MNIDLSYFWSGRLTTIVAQLRDADSPVLSLSARGELHAAYLAVNRALSLLEADREEAHRKSKKKGGSTRG